MAFSTSHMAKISALLEFVIISAIVNEASSSWQEFNGPIALVRLKRAPQRAFTYSGFNPNNGITALATSADFFPPSSYYNYQSLYSLSPSQYGYAGRGQAEHESPSPSSPPSPPSSPASDTASSDYFPDYQRPTSEYPTADPSTEDRSFPSPNLSPPSEGAPVSNYNPNSAIIPKEYIKKKKPSKLTEDDDDDDDDDVKSKSKSTSSASFNAWFPIVLGMYPSRGNRLSNAYKEEAENVSSKNQYPDRYTDRELGNTVIANSVSHGKSSVASSHAIAYGGEPAMKSYRKDEVGTYTYTYDEKEERAVGSGGIYVDNVCIAKETLGHY